MKYFLMYSIVTILSTSISASETQNIEKYDTEKEATSAAACLAQEFSEDKRIGSKRPHPDSLQNKEEQIRFKKNCSQSFIPVLKRRNAEKP